MLTFLAVWTGRLFYLLATLAAVYTFSQPALKSALFLNGKLSKSKNAKEAPFQIPQLPGGPLVNDTVKLLLTTTRPKSWFQYFYLWASNWNLLLLAVSLGQASTSPVFSHLNLALLMLQAHFMRRAYESKFVEKHSDQSQMLLGHFVLGMLFYTFTSLSVVLDTPQDVELHFWLPLIVGVFGFANWKQFQLHAILGKLRALPADKDAYKVPRDDWFGMITCPHYTCEIILYFTLALLFDFRSLSLNLCFVWVSASLGLLAWETFQWYIQTFPKERLFFHQRDLLVKFLL